MPTVIEAPDVSALVRDGHNRIESYRNASKEAIREFAGNYYFKIQGMTGEMPINLLFIALRTWVPNLSARTGVNRVITDVLEQQDYAHLLGLGLDQLHRKIGMREILRAGIVNMILSGIAIFKTSIEATDNLLPAGDNRYIDPGQVFTDLISLDDFFIDPFCTSLNTASMMGHFVTVRRQTLLDQEGWDRDLVMRLPSADAEVRGDTTAKMLSQQNSNRRRMISVQDYVRVAEVYIPDAQAIVYVPDPHQSSFDGYLKIMEYYGPATGPYRFGSLTPPVPDNPMPVAPVSMWRDLNAMANNIFVKLMHQADRQKDVMLFKGGMEDVADAIGDALDGEKVRTSDPAGVQVVSFGGGNNDNDRMVGQLQNWFNYVAGNPDQAAGVKTPAGAKTATAQQILQSNATVTQEDAKGLIYDLQAGISSDQAWYFHHDPLINTPLITRTSGGDEVQVFLTPEQRVSAYEHLTFKIIKRSMQELDPQIRRRNVDTFVANDIPAATNSAMMMGQMGVEFNLTRFLSQVADEKGISDVMVGVFNDPDFQRRVQLMQEHGPKPTDNKSASLAGVLQNNGNPNTVNVPDAGQAFNQQSQETAALAQSDFAGVG